MQTNLVAVYGGSFDPPHKGHENIVKSLVNNKIAKEVWVSPCAKRPDKVFVLSDEERYTLLQELFKDIAEVKVLNIEIEHGAMIPTYQLITILKKQHPDKQFGFVIGSDLIEELKNWKHPVELHNEIRFIICNRKGFEIDKAHLPVHYTIIDVPPIELSSTDIITIFREHITAEEKVTRISDNLSEPALKLLKHKGLI